MKIGNILDTITSIPYRVFGILGIIFLCLASVPWIIIPTFLALISNGMSFNDAKEIGELFFGDYKTNSDLIDAFYELGWYFRSLGWLFKQGMKLFSMIIGGVYYDEMFQYMMYTEV